MNPLRVGGIILGGGESKRMGRPKAWLPFGGETMLQRVATLLRTVVEPIVVVAAPEQQLPPMPGESIIVHDAEKGRGPLQGLAAGLHALKGRADAAYVSSCDVPFLSVSFVKHMIALLGEELICVPMVGARFHPLAAVYRIEAAQTAERLLAAGRLRTSLLFEMVPTRVVSESELVDVDPEFRSLRNLNSPEDYEAALRETSE